jgi:hypothetical protein
MRMRMLGTLLVVMSLGLAGAGKGDKKKLVSGPQVGKTLPGPFDSRVVNGEFKGKQHCLVCENRLFPVVLVFVREPKELDEKSPILYLFEKLEDAMERHEIVYLKGVGIFLSPHAHSSATVAGEKKAEELVAEAKDRLELSKKLESRAAKLKNVVLASFPEEGPKGYKIHPDAEVTIIFFNTLKVLTNEAYPEGKLTREDVDRFVATVDKTIRSFKGTPPEITKP